MSYCLVPAGMAPPADKPWLLSSRDDLAADEEEKEEYMAKLKAICPFPGVSADWNAKLQWMKSIHETVDKIQDETFWQSNCPDADDACAEILEDAAPERLWLEVYADRDQLKEIQVDKEEAFRAGLSTYGRVDYTGEATWEAYLEWLLVKGQKEARLSDDKAVVCIGYIQGAKDDQTVDRLVEFAESLGISGSSLNDFLLLDQRELRSSCGRWGLMKKLSNNVWLPSTKGLSVRALISFDKQTELTEIGRANNAFQKQLYDTRKRYEEAGNPKTCLLVKKPTQNDNDDNDEGKEVLATAETIDVLWLPKFFAEERERAEAHFNGRGECTMIRNRLLKGNTDTGDLTVCILNSNFLYVKDYLRGFPAKLCGALALTLAATNHPYWMHDNESPEELEEAIRLLSNYWRTNLLKRTDAELGIGLEDEGVVPSDNGEMSESRRALYTLMTMRAKSFDVYAQIEGSDKKVALKWKPGKPRKKRKDSPKSVADDIATAATSKKQCGGF